METIGFGVKKHFYNFFTNHGYALYLPENFIYEIRHYEHFIELMALYSLFLSIFQPFHIKVCMFELLLLNHSLQIGVIY